MSRTVKPIREQTRAVVRSLLARTALDLFIAEGYDETTLDDVAASAGVSRRTLFNYFRSKEDLALGGVIEQGEVIARALAERPADEEIWTSLRAAFGVLEELQLFTEAHLEALALVFRHDALRAGHAEKRARWHELLTPLIAERLPASERRDFAAGAIAGAAISCLHGAMEEWVRLEGRADVLALFDLAVTAVRRES